MSALENMTDYKTTLGTAEVPEMLISFRISMDSGNCPQGLCDSKGYDMLCDSFFNADADHSLPRVAIQLFTGIAQNPASLEHGIQLIVDISKIESIERLEVYDYKSFLQQIAKEVAE